MFRSFHIQNFRCFRDLKLDNLERVNLIAGQNNVGKTALLEAIFLHLGPNNPELSIKINLWRGFQRLTLKAEEVWNSLFFDQNCNNAIEITSENEKLGRAVLNISLANPDIALPIGFEATNGSAGISLTTASDTSQLKLEYRDSQNQHVISWAMTTPQGLQGQPGKLLGLVPGLFISTIYRSPQEDAERFSELARLKQQGILLDTLRIVEPRLSHLEVHAVSGASIIYGDVGLSELLPVSMMGDGLVRLLSLILAIRTVKGGVAIIDEIENGLHYSVMAKVWTAIAQAARAADVQIFATTHSWECITAAHQAFSESDTYDFRLHRLDRIGEDIRAVTLNQKMLDTAIQSGLEVR